jgi:hypothetical protein
LFGEIINIIKENTEAVLDTIWEIDIEINTEKTRQTYMPMYRHYTIEQNHFMKLATKP